VKSRISRRGFLQQSLCGAALAGAVVLPAWGKTADLLPDISSRGRRKVSKAAAHYRDRPNGPQRCGGCVHFRGGSCEIVEGRISPNGWCRFYKRMAGGGYGGGRSGGGGGAPRGGAGGGY